MRKLLWNSIKVSFEFKQITRDGKKFQTPFFIFFSSPSKDFRLGVVASKKVGNAVKRNKAKRVLRSAFSQVYTRSKNSSIVLIAKHQILTTDYKEILFWMSKTDLRSNSENGIKCDF